MRVEWAQFKNFVENRSIDMLMLEDANTYFLFAAEDNAKAECVIDKNASDTTDLDEFESSYKSNCNPKKMNIINAATPVNEHCMEPFGCVKGSFETRPSTGQKYVCSITLSNKSVDGLTFNYNSDIEIVPEIGNYVFQNDSTHRSWITSIDTTNHLVTFEMPDLDNGDGIYSKAYYVDCLVRDWSQVMYLWGMTLTVREYKYEDSLWMEENNPCGDFCEFSIVDKSDLFRMDAVTQALFGVDAADAIPYLEGMKLEDNGEFNHWTKYYDESWILNCDSKYLAAPDGSPGEIMPGLWFRIAFFSTENENRKYKIYIDYYPTSKS